MPMYRFLVKSYSMKKTFTSAHNQTEKFRKPLQIWKYQPCSAIGTRPDMIMLRERPFSWWAPLSEGTQMKKSAQTEQSCEK